MNRTRVIASGGEGAPLRLDAAALTDLSANIFAALLLILLILLASMGARGLTDARRDLGSRTRAPLGSTALVDALRARAAGSFGTGIDVTATRIRVAGPGAPDPGEAPFAAVERWLASAGPGEGEPIRLYVFSHRLYAPLVGRLERAGRSWQEIAVPAALRDRSGEAWSPAFLSLPSDPVAFRDGLARLLAASPPGPLRHGLSAGSTAAERSAAPGMSDGSSLAGRIGRWVAAGLEIAAIAAGCLIVLAVEKLVPTSGRR